MSNVHVKKVSDYSDTYATPAGGDIFDRYLNAQAAISAAQDELRFCKKELVRAAVDAGAIEALTVNVIKLRRMLGR